jgi:hypothetical protein
MGAEVPIVTTPLAACALAALALAAAIQDPAPMVKESETGISFPAWIEAPAGDKTMRQDLLGVGVREKTILKVNVYALGLYVDVAAATPLLAKAAGKLERKKALKDAGFQAVLLRDDVAKSLRWVMARDVGASDIAEAFSESLEPRVRKLAKTDEEKQAAAAALATFRGWFASGELTEGTELRFHAEPGGRLHVFVGGAAKGTVVNAILCAALFDVYVGADPISSGAKASILEGAWRLAEAARAAPPAAAPSSR